MTPYIGEIRPFCGNFAPVNWAICDGSVINISQNEALFTLIGTTYGGNGQTTFALPDLRGRVPVGVGQGPGLSNHVLGQLAGSETVTLNITQLPAHNHTLNAVNAAADNASPGGAIFGQAKNPFYVPSASGTTVDALASPTVGNSGGSQPHNNLMPSLVVNYIIALYGIYPTAS